MIQNAVKEFLGREDLDRHVNGDEGAAIGAAFFAAGLSASFRVKEVRLRDITHYPVNVKINLDQAGDADNEIVIEEEEGWFEIVFLTYIYVLNRRGQNQHRSYRPRQQTQHSQVLNFLFLLQLLLGSRIFSTRVPPRWIQVWTLQALFIYF